MSFARCLCFLITFACPLDLHQAQVPSPAPSLDDPAIEKRITKLIHYADSSTGPGAPHPDYREQVAEGNVGLLEKISGRLIAM